MSSITPSHDNAVAINLALKLNVFPSVCVAFPAIFEDNKFNLVNLAQYFTP